MALKFIEGFETSGDVFCLQRKWAKFSQLGSLPVGRLHGKAANMPNALAEWRTRPLGLQNTWVVGFGMRYNSATVIDRTTVFPLVVKRGTTEQIRFQFRKGTGNTFKFDVFKGVTLLGSSSDFVALSWHYFEFKFTIDPVTGSLEIRHNTQVDLTVAGPVDTADSGLAGADVFEIIATNGGPLEYDDMYILDSTGAINNTYLGDSVIEGRAPSSDATPLQWTLEDGGNPSIDQHYEAIEFFICTGASIDSYIFSSTVGQQDMFAFSALSFITGQIHGVLLTSDSRLDTTGTREFKHIIRSNATLYTSPPGGSTHTVASTAFQGFFDMFEVDPDTSAKWTIPNLNAAEFGLEVVS